MDWRKLLASLVFVLASAIVAQADDGSVEPASWFRFRSDSPSCCYPPCPTSPYYPPGLMPSTSPEANPNIPAVPPNNLPQNQDTTNPFASATAGGGLQGRAFNENFDGDFGGVFYSKTVPAGFKTETVQTGTRTVTTIVTTIGGDGQIIRTPVRTIVPVFTTLNIPLTRVIRVPVGAAYAGVLITDNDSPVPVDRVYAGYNYYAGMGSSFNQGVGGGINQNRETIGFEKTFLDGNASFGMRLPFVEFSGPFSSGGSSVGDLSVLFKYAFINDARNIVSGGFIVTAPTSQIDGDLANGIPIYHSVLFQPWAGFVHNFDRAYIEGITDLIAPSNGHDTLVWTNSLAAGYWLYQNFDSRILNGIIPTAEIHVHNPLNNRSLEGLIYLPDEVNITAGVHLRFPRATLTGAVSFPMVGPHPYNMETIVNLNFWF